VKGSLKFTNVTRSATFFVNLAPTGAEVAKVGSDTCAQARAYARKQARAYVRKRDGRWAELGGLEGDEGFIVCAHPRVYDSMGGL
jgi:hypothetical protein